MRSFFIFLLTLVMVPITAFASTTPSWDPAWKSWLDILHTQYAVSVNQGSAYLLTSCTQYLSVFGSCGGNNPAAPYVIIQPPVTDEYVDPVYGLPFQNEVSFVNGIPTPCSGSAKCKNVNQFYQLADNEALVVIVSMPPQAAYFGYQTYVDTKYVGGTKGTSPDNTRDGINGSIGNAINNQVIGNKTEAAPFGTVAGQGQQVAFITTSNAALEQGLRKTYAAVSKNGQSAVLITEPIWSTNNSANPGMVPTGTGQSSSDLITFLRYALSNPEYQSEAEAWRTNINDYVQVYKISAPTVATTSLFGPVNYTAKSGTSESQYMSALNELESLLNNYLASIQGTAETSPMVVSEFVNSQNVPDAGLVGQRCIVQNSECLGDSQDTDAYRIGNVGILATGKSFFVVGVNHAQTRNASYVSIAANDSNVGEGVASISTTDSSTVGFSAGALGGSAQSALQSLGLLRQASPNLKALLPYLYVAMFTRNACNPLQTFCTQLGTASETGVPYSDKVSILERAYLNPGTTTGADPALLLDGAVIH